MRREFRHLFALALLVISAFAAFAPSARATPARQTLSPPFKWSVQELMPPSGHQVDSATVPGFYCASCGSGQCRLTCLASGAAVGMENRFLLCELMPAENVYDLSGVRRWVRANAAVGLRSIIGFNFKTSRGYDAPGGGSCTPTSDGSPAWMLAPGSVYQPLQNGTGAEATYHLNYRNAAVQNQVRGLMQALRQELARLPNWAQTTVDSIEVDIGHDGEMDAARNYDNYPPNAPLGWMDADMYRCIYAGYTWHPRRYRQYCTDGNGALVDPSQAWAAAHVWRDEVVKPIIDIYGQELSQAAQGDELGRPMALMIAGQLLSADEHASPCAGCGERNLSDYAFQTYGMGAKSTGVNPDTGSGNGSDSLYAEYRNWPNVFKLNWPRWLTVGEHGVNSIGGGHCCDDPQELYWAVLTGLDLHMSQLHFLGSDLGQPGAGAEAARQLFARYAGRGIFTTPDVWIVFRDTEGTYYPNGDNGQPEGDPPGRRPCCRALPNYEWFIYQRNPAPEQVVRTGLPDAYQSLSARSDAYGALQLDIEDLWWGSRPPIVPLACRAYDVEVEFLDAGVDSFLVRYATPDGAVVSRSVQKTGTGRWRSVTLNLQDVAFSDGLPSGADLTLANPDGSPDIFHRVRVELLGDCQ